MVALVCALEPRTTPERPMARAMGPSGGTCGVADALFLPLENKLASKPATTACCCKCELRKGVLIIGLSIVALGLVEALVIMLVVPAPAGTIVGGIMLMLLLVLGKGVWSVYNRELAGSASDSPSVNTQTARVLQRRTYAWKYSSSSAQYFLPARTSFWSPLADTVRIAA